MFSHFPTELHYIKNNCLFFNAISAKSIHMALLGSRKKAHYCIVHSLFHFHMLYCARKRKNKKQI